MNLTYYFIMNGSTEHRIFLRYSLGLPNAKHFFTVRKYSEKNHEHQSWGSSIVMIIMNWTWKIHDFSSSFMISHPYDIVYHHDYQSSWSSIIMITNHRDHKSLWSSIIVIINHHDHHEWSNWTWPIDGSSAIIILRLFGFRFFGFWFFGFFNFLFFHFPFELGTYTGCGTYGGKVATQHESSHSVNFVFCECLWSMYTGT